MSLFSGISNALKSAGSAVANYIAPKTSAAPMSTAFTNTQAPFLLSGTTNTNALPQPKSSPTVSAGNVISAGGVRQSSFGGSGAVLNADSAGYSYSPGVSTGGTGLPQIPSPNRITTSSGSYNLAPINYFTGNNTNVDPITGGLINPVVSGAQGASGSSTQSLGTSPSGGFTSISGGQGLLPGSIGSVSRGGFGMGAGQISGTKMLQGSNVERQDTRNQQPYMGSFLSNLFKNAYSPKVPDFGASAGIKSPTINVKDLAGTQMKDTSIASGQDVLSFQNELTGRANDIYTSIASINNPQGESFIQAPGTGAPPEGSLPIVPQYDAQGNALSSSGQVIRVQSDASTPRYIREAGGTEVFDTSGGTLRHVTEQEATAGNIWGQVQEIQPGSIANLLQQPVENQVLESPDLQQQSAFNLQEEYNRLQKESGISQAIAQLKDLESQTSAIEQALTAQKDAIMSDPDMSLATKEGRINYIFNNSMEARTYEALTARQKVLGDFIDRQNELISKQLGFAQQDFQNRMAYAAANKTDTGEGDIKEVGGNIYVYNKSAGKWENRGSAAKAAESMTPQDRYKLMNQQSWKQNYDVVNNQLGMIDNAIIPYGGKGSSISMSANDINAIDWTGVANDGSGSLDTIVTAAYRMKRPDLTRINPDGTITDSGSLPGQISQKINELLNDQDAAPDKLKALFVDAVRNYSVYRSSYNKGLTEFNNMFSNPLGLDLPKADGGDTASTTGMRTDRHNNPTAFTTDIAKLAGLREGVEYTAGDPFSGGKYRTAKLLGDPIATTIKVIDRIGFQTAGGSPRWTYISMPKSQWDSLSYSQKKNVIGQMYQHEGGKTLASLFGSNTA